MTEVKKEEPKKEETKKPEMKVPCIIQENLLRYNFVTEKKEVINFGYPPQMKLEDLGAGFSSLIKMINDAVELNKKKQKEAEEAAKLPSENKDKKAEYKPV